MGLAVAFKAFMKAWREPEQGEKFVQGKLETKAIPEQSDPSHLRLLAILQQSGRLIDFLKEDITGYNDAQVGAAVRRIHADCGKSLEELVTIRPVMEESEGSTIRVLQGYDPNSLKVVGKVKGEPPYSGVLVHKGWKAHKRSLPKKVGESNPDLICPAEVEVK
jgi:hypothetical protein